jgi:hypothetical protein
MKQLFKSGKLGKSILLPFIAIAVSIATSAQPYFQKSLVESREIKLIKEFNKIEVAGDVTIILTHNIEGKVFFYGHPEDVQVSKAFIKNGRLVIDANRKKTLNKLTVYLPASNIRSLVTSGKTEIFSSGTIKAQDLEILLNGSSLVSINYDGHLKITPGMGYELTESRN